MYLETHLRYFKINLGHTSYIVPSKILTVQFSQNKYIKYVLLLYIIDFLHWKWPGTLI